MKLSFPLVPLKEILSESEDRADILPNQWYVQLTVRLWGKGVVQRSERLGAEIAVKRQRVVHSQQFIMSRIDARHGAFGLVPDSLEGAIASHDFPTFNLDKSRILPKFLDWISKTRSFIDLCKESSEGTTNRVRVQAERFLSARIPLPSLSDQRELVIRLDELNTKLAEAKVLKEQVCVQGESFLTAALGRTFDTLSRLYPVEPLGKLCETTSGGTPSRTRSDFFDGNIAWVKSGELEDRIITQTEERISEAALDESSAKVFPRGTLLVALYGATVGRTGILDIAAASNQAVCAVFPSGSLNRDYVWWFLRRMRPTFLRRSFGGAQPNISQTLLRRAQIPVPPLTEQERIAARNAEFSSKLDQLIVMQREALADLDAMLPSILNNMVGIKH